MDTLKSKIRHVPDFPKPGILFYDITTLLQDPTGRRMIAMGVLAQIVGNFIIRKIIKIRV